MPPASMPLSRICPAMVLLVTLIPARQHKPDRHAKERNPDQGALVEITPVVVLLTLPLKLVLVTQMPGLSHYW